MLVAQSTICEAVGVPVTMREWGAPNDDGDDREGGLAAYIGAAEPISAAGRSAARPPPTPTAPPPFDVTDVSDEPYGYMQQPAQPAVQPSPRHAEPMGGLGSPAYGAERLAHEASLASGCCGAMGDDARPSTANSVASMEADPIRRKNQGSSVFG